MKKSVHWRYENLHPDYEIKEAPEHGVGLFSVHRVTQEVCDCKMKWNQDGTRLTCPVCGVDGT